MTLQTKMLVALGASILGAILGVVVVSERPAQVEPKAPGAVASRPSAGAIDEPRDEATVADSIVVTGWALDSAGIEGVALRLAAGEAVGARYGLPRPDVAAVMPGYPNAREAGFEIRASFSQLQPTRHPFAVVATNSRGAENVLGKRSLIPPEAFRIWPATSSRANDAPRQAFHFLMATSGVAQGGAAEIDTIYKGYASTTQRIGFAVPILYLRTTKGRDGDWMFDPDFDVTRKCGDRLLAEDSLSGVIRTAIERRLPVQFILNGGIWADATCDSPDWDLNDHLEQSESNCQWTQDNRVLPDGHLKNLAGSTASPELARSLTYNVYATDVRKYKRRNLQAAARRIAEFARAHPELFVGVNLDSDTYINPFFEEREWFDYNPATLRQFREWLRGDGPYLGRGGPDIPDLRAWRRPNPLTLAEVNRLARRDWKSWSEVDPPRRFPGSKRDALAAGELPVWDDPWFWEWDTFRKHLVALHYGDLARWTHEAGIPHDRIHTAQGFVAPELPARPFAVRITSHGQNYDSGGVSVEGAIPRDGHLGAILYGPAAENRARMEDRHSLFATFARMDPGWAVVEMNMADLRRPEALPTYAIAYRAFRDLFNHDAKQVSLMAWNGSNGIYAGQPGYVSYTSWRNTPAEEAMRDHMILHANLALGSRLWTFGSAQHADDDGWSAEDATLAAGRGRITVRANGPSRSIALLSPADQVIRRATTGRLIFGLARPQSHGVLEVWAERAPGSGWRRLATTATANPEVVPAGLSVALDWPSDWPTDAVAERLKIVLSAANFPAEWIVERIALIGRHH